MLRSRAVPPQEAPLQENSLKHMTTRTRLRPPEERVSPHQHALTTALDNMKAVNVRVLDVRELTDVFDAMVIASGNSDRHVRSIAERVVEKAKAAGFRPLGTEGARDGEWVLVDLQDILVHVMLPRLREFYGLERRQGRRRRGRAAPAGAGTSRSRSRSRRARQGALDARARRLARGTHARGGGSRVPHRRARRTCVRGADTERFHPVALAPDAP